MNNFDRSRILAPKFNDLDHVNWVFLSVTIARSSVKTLNDLKILMHIQGVRPSFGPNMHLLGSLDSHAPFHKHYHQFVNFFIELILRFCSTLTILFNIASLLFALSKMNDSVTII